MKRRFVRNFCYRLDGKNPVCGRHSIAIGGESGAGPFAGLFGAVGKESLVGFLLIARTALLEFFDYFTGVFPSITGFEIELPIDGNITVRNQSPDFFGPGFV